MLSPGREELAQVVRALHEEGTPWLPAGRGSRLSWGARLSRPHRVLSVAALDRIL
jgi:glycolate oxidase FAD binding subunit